MFALCLAALSNGTGQLLDEWKQKRGEIIISTVFRICFVKSILFIVPINFSNINYCIFNTLSKILYNLNMHKVLYLTFFLLTLLTFVTSTTPACGDGQLLFDSTCIPIAYIQGCALYLSNGQCKTCQYGYALSSAGRCLPNLNQTADCCNAYNSDGSCSKCSNGLFWSDPYCFRNQIAGCIRKDLNKCQVCGSGYFLKNGICLIQINGCESYNDNGECSGCASGNKLLSGFCYPNPAFDNCQHQNQYGCVRCDVGFYLTPLRSCVKYEAGCLKYWQANCLACHPNFYMNQNKKCVIDGCQVYNFDSCAQCQQNYTAQNGKCTINGCIKVINNVCVQCKEGLRLSAKGCVQAVSYQCTSCSAGYTFINNACIKVISGCLQYNSNNLCTSCQAPFQLTINGDCQILGCQRYFETGCSGCFSPFVLKNSICVIDNCLRYVNDGCSQCNDGYQLVNKQCFVKDTNCLQYSLDSNNNPICAQCAARFYLFQGVCRPASKGCNYDNQGKCTCKTNFNVSPKGTCQIVGCNNYNWETCLSCDSPFTYNTQSQLCSINNCAKYSWSGCQGCDKGWVAANGQCLVGDINCLSYNAKGVCISCKQGFNLDSSSRCVKNIPYCEVFTNDKLNCAQCQAGFVLLNGLCYSKIDNCQDLGVQNGISFCKCCRSGYRLSKGLCVINDSNCLTYAINTADQFTEVCSKCKQGFFFAANGGCVAQLPGCVYKNNECVSCTIPFIYDSSKKNCFIPGCQIYTKSGCSQCSSAFKLINGSCTIDFCSGYNSNGCVSCISGYALTDYGQCALIDPNCFKYQGSSCSQCKDGFSLTKEGTCVVVDLNCKSYSNGVCQTCSSAYYLNPAKKCIIKENGCVYESGVCKSCISPFRFDQNKKTCVINACIETDSIGCTKCKSPFAVSSDKTCKVKNCLRSDNSGCIQCGSQYHLKNGQCFEDKVNCKAYKNGFCELCTKGFVLSSDGQCIQTSNAACLSYCQKDKTKCLQCGNDYFLNSFFQCEKKDGNCQEYINGVCSKCKDKFFLYSFICFPYTRGCVQYNGKDCTQCKVNYVLKNGQCFLFKAQNPGFLGGEDHYDFDINPIDVRQSKYYINNLSPASEIGKFFFSSYSDASYQDCSLSTLEGYPSKGWKAKVADQNQYIGIHVTESPVIFYAIQLEAVEDNYITEFYLEYSVNGTEFITVQNSFKVPSTVSSKMTTIYFTGIYATAIRIRISGFKGWPAARINFFYYDQIRMKKISNLKSLTYLQNTINSTFVDRVDNQIYINQVYFFNPNAACTIQQMCFTGLQLCQKRQITGLVLNFQNPSNYVTQFYLTYSVDGRSYNCYKNCQVFNVSQLTNGGFSLNLQSLSAQGVRIYPKNYKGSANFSPTFFYN